MNGPNVLNALRLPGLDRTGAAKLIGRAEHDLAILEKHGLVRTLGGTAQNAPRWYPAARDP